MAILQPPVAEHACTLIKCLLSAACLCSSPLPCTQETVQLGVESEESASRGAVSMPMDAFPHTYYVVPEARHVRVCSLLVFADGAPAVNSLAAGRACGRVASGHREAYARTNGSSAQHARREQHARGEERQAGGRIGWWTLVVCGVAFALLAQVLLPRMKLLSLDSPY